MALDRGEYPAMVAALQPAHAVNVLDERVRVVAQINTGIAEWLLERRKIEEQYALGLRRLARRAAIAEPEELGVFATPWSALLANLDNLADAHSNLASKIEVDVENPLRSFNTSNREMTSMGNIQGNLAAIAKEVDAAQKKVDKSAKGSTQKAAAANAELESAKGQWDSQAPFVFESLQALDESRLNHLRDVLTQLETHEIDKVERSRIAAETCLNVLLTVETADEIKTFALRTSNSEPPNLEAPRRPSRVQTSSSMASLPPATPTATNDDRGSQRGDTVPEMPTPKSDKPRGLRRLGTVLSRRRESKIPAGAGKIGDTPDGTPERKSRLPNSSTFSSLTGRGGRSQPIDSLREEGSERPSSPLRTITSRSTADAADERPTANGTNGIPDPAAANIPNGSHQSDLAGLSMNEPTMPPRQTSEAGISFASNDGSSNDRGRSRDLDPISAAEAEAASQEAANPAFKVAIQDAPAAPGAGDAEALNNIANTLKMQAPQVTGARRQGTARGRRDNRASVYDSPLALNLPGRIAEAPIQEQAAAPEAPAQTATAAVPVVSPQPAVPALFGQAAPFASMSGAGGGPQSPAFAPRPASAQKDDAGSVRSGRSYASNASASHRHPEQTTPGLNASIIETVSATFEQGVLARSVVIGEVALTNNSDASSEASETIRLGNFSSLDKVAPNPAFLANSGGVGAYNLDLVQLGRGRSQIAFKYQLSPSATAAGSLAPILLHPQWKVEPNQTSVIVLYSLNPSFNLGGQESVTLKDMTLMLHLGEGSKASSCMSKPVGTFNKERGVIYWSLGEVTLSKATEGQPQRLLARFVTEGEARQGKLEARWTSEGANVLAGGDTIIEVKRGEDDPFSDAVAEKWVPLAPEATRKRLVAGTYVGS